MNQGRIILNHNNYAILKGLIETLKRSGKMNQPLKQPHFFKLAKEMENAIVMDPEMMPEDVVSIHSQVTYTSLAAQSVSEVVIVFPVQIKDAPNYISIFTPLGLALIGERQGNVIDYEAPGGSFRLKIDKVVHLDELFLNDDRY